MLKKKLVFLFAALFAFPNIAQTEEIRVDSNNNVISNNIPAIKEPMNDFVVEMIQTMAPILLALNENKKLPIANAEMADKIKKAITEKYNKETSYIIDIDNNSIELDGKYEENGTLLKYRLTRNLAMTIATYDILEKEELISNTIPDNMIFGQTTTLSNLDDKKIDIDKFKKNKINNHMYIGHLNKSENYIYLLTNIGAYLTLQIQVKGDKFASVAKEFVYSIDFEALKKAVSDDGRNLINIKKMIEENSKDPNKIDELFEKQN